MEHHQEEQLGNGKEGVSKITDYQLKMAFQWDFDKETCVINLENI